MHVLVTNDDGYLASGIIALVAAIRDAVELLTVVAPVRNHSGASSSLTVNRDIEVYQKGDNVYAVEGTPVDCVHLALTSDFLPKPPDLIVSGINDGTNMGDDTIYSGTVAAAIEGYLFGVPAFAFSMAAATKPAQHFQTGALVARQMVERYRRALPAATTLLNINIPDVPASQLGGCQQTRLGRRHLAEPAIRKEKSADKQIFAIGEAGRAKEAGPGTDFYAVEQGHVSVTPLMVDLTAFDQLQEVEQWLSQ